MKFQIFATIFDTTCVLFTTAMSSIYCTSRATFHDFQMMARNFQDEIKIIKHFEPWADFSIYLFP